MAPSHADSSPTREGDTPSPDPIPPQRLDSRAVGAWRSRSFSFTTRTLSISHTVHLDRA